MKDNNVGKTLWIPIIITAIVVIGLWVWTYFALVDRDKDWRGTFGDMFGGINALFSGLAFGGIIITILLQSKELSLQRDELKNTTEELKRTANAQEDTGKAVAAQLQMMEKQQFESAFFNLLQMHSELVKNIDIRKKVNMGNLQVKLESVTIHGKDCFKFFYETFKTSYTSTNNPDFNAVYLAFFSNYQNDLSHYFRTLYHIVKFVDQSNISDKKRYTSIVRAQLSAFELLLLFYNGLSPLGTKFKPLINEYNLLKNLNSTDLLNSQHIKLYNITSG